MPEIKWIKISIIDPDHWYKVDASCMTHDQLDASMRQFIFERDDFTCAYCGKSAVLMHVDHVIPKSRGGPDEPENLVCACEHCNTSKRDKTPDEWGIVWQT